MRVDSAIPARARATEIQRLANATAALNYARERNWRTAIAVVLAYSVQALWRLPLFAHATVGIMEGLSGSLKDFVITPKSSEDLTVLRTLMSQRPVIGVSFASVVTLAVQPRHIDLLLLASIWLSILTICALFLVPLTKWISRWVLPRNRPRLSVTPRPVVTMGLALLVAGEACNRQTMCQKAPISRPFAHV